MMNPISPLSSPFSTGKTTDALPGMRTNANGESVKSNGEKCEKCGSDMVFKIGPYGKYMQCTNETCKNRKYQDGSDEMVSFKSATHLSPTQAGAAVRAHEQEHVSNAYKKASNGNGEVIHASVTIHTAVCPECGRSYVSGGTTNTQIKYYNEENPYQKDLKLQDSTKYKGMNINQAG